MLDLVAGEVAFGPGVRQPDGTMRQLRRRSRRRAPVFASARYRTGGGTIGQRGGRRDQRAQVVDPVRCPCREPAAQRAAASTARTSRTPRSAGPILLRTRDRAVTAEDYEYLAREAAPEVARVRALTAEDGAEAGSVRLLVVPSISQEGRLELDHLTPSDATLVAIKKRLDDTRVIGTRVLIETPGYQGVSVVATLRARPRTSRDGLRDAALEALYSYFDPITGGPDGSGWPFGRPVNLGEIYSILQGLRGTEYIEEARLFPVDLATRKLDGETNRIDIDAHTLILSFQHDVQVAS